MNCIEALKQPRNETSAGLPLVLVAAVALVDKENRVLLAKRPADKPMPGLWEFPGGKIKEGETPEFALVRELAEELAIETRECCFAPLGFASHSYAEFHLLMPLYVCRMWEGEPKPVEGQVLEWVKPTDFTQYDMPEADIPLIYQIQDRL